MANRLDHAVPSNRNGFAQLQARRRRAVALAGGGNSVVVTNTSASLAYVGLAPTLSVAASNADMPVLANARIMLGEQSGQLRRRRARAQAAVPCCSPAATDPISDGVHGRGKDRHSALLRLSRPTARGDRRVRRTGDSFRPTDCWSSA